MKRDRKSYAVTQLTTNNAYIYVIGFSSYLWTGGSYSGQGLYTDRQAISSVNLEMPTRPSPSERGQGHMTYF